MSTTVETATVAVTFAGATGGRPGMPRMARDPVAVKLMITLGFDVDRIG